MTFEKRIINNFEFPTQFKRFLNTEKPVLYVDF